MKKNKIIIFIIFLTAFGCTKDILDKKPMDIITEEDVWNNPVLIDIYLNGIYAEMPFRIHDVVRVWGWSWPNVLGNWQGAFRVAEEIEASDECKRGRMLSNRGMPNWKLGNLKAEGRMLEWWGYSTVRKLNDFIERVQVSPIDDEIKTQRIAEARFLRAFCYFTMVKRYGGVPLITKVQEIDDTYEELYRKRNKEEEIYNFIFSELDAIVDDLPETYSGSDYGRPTKYAALALKSKAALFAASIAQWGQVQLDGVVGIPANKASTLWQASYDASKEIIQSGKYTLYNNYPDDKVKNYQQIFLDERNTETIFAKQYTGQTGIGHNWDFVQIPVTYHPWGGGHESIPYWEMVEEYENIDGTSGKIDRDLLTTKLWTIEELYGNKDPRFKASIYTQNTSLFGNNLQMYYGIITEQGEIITKGYYKGIRAVGKDKWVANPPFGVLKFLDLTMKSPKWSNASTTDWIVYRYGETLLNFAEAAFELGKTGEALDAVNQIRSRAGIAPLSSIDQNAIRHERKIELAFSGERYWDLRRWRTAVNKLTRDFSSIRYLLDYSTGKFKIEIIEKVDGMSETPVFYEKNYYLPITPKRIANNPNLIENPGY